MTEIIINLRMDDSGDVTITNTIANKTVEINYVDKELMAKDVYDLLSYEAGCHYLIKSESAENANEEKRSYFKEINDLFDKIIEQLNSIKSSIEETES